MNKRRPRHLDFEETPPPIEMRIPKEETPENNGQPAPCEASEKILHPAFTPIVKRPISVSPQMTASFELIEKVAPSDLSVTITGETGTGKEVAANLIHELSERKGRFVRINCAAIPRDLIESEIFGSVKGSFTGSTCDRAGLIDQAEGGTFLFDELSEMPRESQAKLLRLLQEKKFYRVGGREELSVDCRIIAATNRPIQEAVKTEKLREDLYYRIAQVVVHLPPLRERTEDIIPLAMEFLRRLNTHVVGFTSEAIDLLTDYPWPGNVRQLENLVVCAALMADKEELIDVCHISLPNEQPHSHEGSPIDELEKRAIIAMLQETGGNKVKTAHRLKIGRQTLYNKIKVYGIKETLTGNIPKAKARKEFSYPGPRMVEDAMKEAENDLAVAAELLEITPEQLLEKLKEYEMPIPATGQTPQG